MIEEETDIEIEMNRVWSGERSGKEWKGVECLSAGERGSNCELCGGEWEDEDDGEMKGKRERKMR